MIGAAMHFWYSQLKYYAIAGLGDVCFFYEINTVYCNVYIYI